MAGKKNNNIKATMRNKFSIDTDTLLDVIKERNKFDNANLEATLLRLKKLLNQDASADNYFRIAKDVSKVANLFEKNSILGSKKLYDISLQAYNQAIRLDHTKKEYRRGRNILPTTIKDPLKRTSIYKDVILQNLDDAMEWRKLINQDFAYASYYVYSPAQMFFDNMNKNMEEFKDKQDLAITANKKNYGRDFFLSSTGAILGAVGLVGLGLSAVAAWPIAIVAGVALFGGSYYFEHRVFKASKEQARLECKKDKDHFLYDELQNSINMVKDAKEAYMSAKAAGQNVTPDHNWRVPTQNWTQRVSGSQNSANLGAAAI